MILCLSDIHLGSPICQADLTLQIIEEERYDKLIICGDLLDSYHIHRLCKKQWKILSTLRKISKNKQCIFIKGNHDKDLEMISSLMGLDFKEEYDVTINNKRILFVHGDKWDIFIATKPILTELASAVYYVFQKIDKKQKYTRKLKQKVKTWHDAAHNLTIKIAQYCYNGKYDAVCFGHTHVPKHEHIGGIECVNLGSQCDLPITYAIIDNQGKIELKSKDNKK
jgi:predicted phosphodiesterase